MCGYSESLTRFAVPQRNSKLRCIMCTAKNMNLILSERYIEWNEDKPIEGKERLPISKIKLPRCIAHQEEIRKYLSSLPLYSPPANHVCAMPTSEPQDCCPHTCLACWPKMKSKVSIFPHMLEHVKHGSLSGFLSRLFPNKISIANCMQNLPCHV
jgi:hypothetical protein